MEKIITYVNNVFSSCPHTEEAARIKMQFIDTLIEKYQALIAEGKNEHEAFGTVIAGFGDIEEIKKTLQPNASSEQTVPPSPQNTDTKQPLDAAGIIAVYREIQQTLKHNTQREIAFVLAGLGLLGSFIFLDIIFSNFRYLYRFGSITGLGVIVFFVCIAFAAAHFIIYAQRTLQVEKEIFHLTGKPEEKDFTGLMQDFKEEGKPFAKKLQKTVLIITILLFFLIIILSGAFETAVSIAIAGIITNVLIGIWMK